MAGEVSAAQIGEHITMPVAILSDGDDAGLVCDHVAAKIMCRCLGCCFRTGREQPVSGGSAAWEPKVRRLSPVEGDGFEPSVPRRNKLCVAPATNVPVAMILCVGNSDQAVRQSWINRPRYAE